MPYFVRVGVIEQNKSGVGARGYYLSRRGTVVSVTFGGIAVLGDRSFVWAWRKPRLVTHRCRTVDLARTKYRALVDEKLREGYARLPTGIAIGPWQRA
jgi:hypothetical protein